VSFESDTDTDAEAFVDLFEANRRFSEHFPGRDLSGRARRGLAVVTCMDSRIDPLAALGLEAGDAKILRNAGARVTDDVLRTLVLAVYLLNVSRVLVMPHTDCRMASATDDEIHRLLYDEYRVDTRSLEFRADPDQLGALGHDLQKVRSHPLLPPRLAVTGAVYDVRTGQLTPVG